MRSFYLKPELLLSLKNYSKAQLIKDITAGIIVAIIALPLSIALALASGVEPVCGVYTAIAAGFVVSLLGGSKIQIAGPTAAFATIVAGVVATQGMDGLFLATIMAGIMLILMGVFKLGRLIKFIPYTITTGFTAGIAITILIGQIKDFLGLTYATGVKPVEAIEKIVENIHALPTFHWQALLVGAVCLAVLIIYPKFEKRVPPSLISVLVGIAMVKLIPGLDAGVYTIGELYTIPAGLPSVNFAGMDFGIAKIVAVLPDAFTIAILAAIESLLSCVVADGMVKAKHNSNAELVAQGAGNIASVLFGGIPATGAIARTAANANNGGRTPVSGMVHSVVLLLVLLILMPYAGLIPMPTIAAILFMVAYNMSEWKRVVSITKTAPKSDTIVMAATLVLTVVFDLVVAIEIGLLLTAILFIKRMVEQTSVKELKDEDNAPSGTRVYEISGPLFFGVSEKLFDISFDENTKCIVLNMSSVTALDATAMNALLDLHKKCEENNIRLVFSQVNEQPLKLMRKSGFADRVGEASFRLNATDALEYANSLCENAHV